MKTIHYVTRNMYLYNSWLADLAGGVIETHLQRRRPLQERPQDDTETRAEHRDDTDQKQLDVLSA